MLAAYHGHSNLVRFLIQRGADPNRLNDRQQSPLAGAVFKKEDDVIEVSCDPWMLLLTPSGLGLDEPWEGEGRNENAKTKTILNIVKKASIQISIGSL